MRSFGATPKRLLLLIGVLALLLGASVTPASALTRAGAAEAAEYWATVDYGGGAWSVTHCTGPYENVKGKTQWACYGYNKNGGCEDFQINVGPYGEQTYHTGLYCET